MAKGAIAKQEILKQLKAAFPNGFVYNDNKEYRINTFENGESVQIKLAVSCALKPVECGDDVALPGDTGSAFPAPVVKNAATETPTPPQPTYIPPTEDEKKNVANLLARLNLM